MDPKDHGEPGLPTDPGEPVARESQPNPARMRPAPPPMAPGATPARAPSPEPADEGADQGRS